ncbi:peptide chain release factor N(5)-glutamine methyltransferase [Prochlorococcus sp. MIT 1300]|uniref:peptide chain release factor N(5)-glutamine methyltransferase n=1 Tax=Prochlorococcus sp. MIT 1300 TaxID=3096218 RepID=UPI002A765DA0|nr:peptide chain release factor N(5)-glutamine methyltransferase [Prochlorococcus sp. MIT 1300]
MSQKLQAKELLNWRKSQLALGGRADDIDWLLDLGGGLSWGALQKLHICRDGPVVLSKSLDELSSFWRRHIYEHIPLQHLIGRCPWRDIELEISPAALIPRQETEILVDLALSRVKGHQPGVWADLGTGSGALAIALTKELPDWNGHAVDCSGDALHLASKNFNALVPGCPCQLHSGIWWGPLKQWWGKLNLVLSNPPYIPSHVFEELHPVVRDHEPEVALIGGEDGLSSLREIIIGSVDALAPGGWLLLEHHHDQSDAVLGMMRDIGLKEISYELDLQGVRRFALGRLTQKRLN